MPELPLNLSVGMSPTEVSKTLGVEFMSVDEVKQSIRGHDYQDFDPDEYLEKIDDLVITDSVKSDLYSRYGTVAFFSEKAAFKARFFKEQLYKIEFEFDLSTAETLSKGDEIKKQILTKYPDANFEKSKEIKDAYWVNWRKESVKANLWVNPVDKILTIRYWDHSIFDPLIRKQKDLSEKGI
ncbi:hypothetical protein [Bdellovibrio bacteriovorus]|uniref:hypothetical protein n=1 Tax=Bdellovibrio bacteriovorus TaxID=959 RepID=UPI003AA87DED